MKKNVYIHIEAEHEKYLCTDRYTSNKSRSLPVSKVMLAKMTDEAALNNLCIRASAYSVELEQTCIKDL